MIDEEFEASYSLRTKHFEEQLKKENSQINEPYESILGSTDEKCKSLFCKSSEGLNVTLDDFQLVSIIGKGNFGKVELFIIHHKLYRFTQCTYLRTNNTML